VFYLLRRGGAHCHCPLLAFIPLPVLKIGELKKEYEEKVQKDNALERERKHKLVRVIEIGLW
jgi:hypothetical protein